jgi:type I restriction enzyme M protein
MWSIRCGARVAKNKEILEILAKRQLVEISHHLGFRGWQVISKGETVKRLSRQRKKPMEKILQLLKNSELRNICVELNLNPGGLKKQTIIDRILGQHLYDKPKQVKIFHRAQKKVDRTRESDKNKTLTKRKKSVASSNGNDIENRLWAAADKLWANTGLRPSEFSTPVLGLIFLRYAETKFNVVAKTLTNSRGRGRARDSKTAYQAKGAIYLPEQARFTYLLELPEGEDIGKALNEAMKLIEQENEDLRGVLPKNYNLIMDWTLVELLKLLGPIEIDGDAFGKVYEYFLGKFAMSEGRKGGVFYTPTAIVKLIVEIIEPFQGKIFDPACGSGGMFVQSARFVERHNGAGNHVVSAYGTEKEPTTIKLSKMNLAVHGLAGDIRAANTYYEDPHKCVGKFEYVMANPPFNVSGVDKERLENDPRFKLGTPNTDNANYLWIQVFYHSLNEKGRAGFVMANSAADARATELEIRKKLVEAGAVDVIVSVGSNFFYTVTLPCTLWFFDKGKAGTDRKDKVLFLDARHIFRQLDRAHRDWTPDQIEFLANIVRLYRDEETEHDFGSDALMKDHGLDGQYVDVPGLCKVATIGEIEGQGWSLNPGRYVGVAEGDPDDFDFKERFQELNDELEILNAEASELEERIAQNVAGLLEI